MNRKAYHEHIKYSVLAALFAAMIYVLTAFVHIPTQQGYVHIGDGVIYLAAALLPTPYAVGAAAIGAGLADYLSGYPIWVLPTVIIKVLTALVFTSKKDSIVNKRNLFAILPAGFICIVGYYIAGTLLAFISGTPLSGSFAAALADIPTNAIQVAGSAVLFVALGKALDKTGVKKRLLSGSRNARAR